jgi:hypothetical protein
MASVLRGAPRQKPAHRLAAACTMRKQIGQIGREHAAQCGSDGWHLQVCVSIHINPFLLFPAILPSHIGCFFDELVWGGNAMLQGHA